LYFLLLILISCKSDSAVEKLSDLDIVKLYNLSFEKDGVKLNFDSLEDGYYYFVSSYCSACLDEELAKIERFNYLNEKKINLVIIDNDEVVRLSKFLSNVSIYRSTQLLSEFSFVLEKRNPNEVVLITLHKILK